MISIKILKAWLRFSSSKSVFQLGAYCAAESRDENIRQAWFVFAKLAIFYGWVELYKRKSLTSAATAHQRGGTYRRSKRCRGDFLETQEVNTAKKNNKIKKTPPSNHQPTPVLPPPLNT